MNKPVLLVLACLTLLSLVAYQTFRKTKTHATRILLIPLLINPHTLDQVEKQTITMHQLLNTRNDIHASFVFVDLDPSYQGDIQEQDALALRQLLENVHAFPSYVFGERISQEAPQLADMQAAYEAIDINSPLASRLIKADTRALRAAALLQFTQQLSRSFDPGARLYDKTAEPQIQFDWLTSQIVSTHRATGIFTQNPIDTIEEAFQKKLTDVVCKSSISMYVFMTNSADLFYQGACPGYSHAMVGDKTHPLLFVGVNMSKNTIETFSYKELVLTKTAIEVIDHKDSLLTP